MSSKRYPEELKIGALRQVTDRSTLCLDSVLLLKRFAEITKGGRNIN